MDIQVYQYILLLTFTGALLLRRWNTIPYYIPFLTIAVFFELVLGKILKYYYGGNLISSNIFVILCVIYYLYLYTHDFRPRWFWIMSAIYFVAIIISAVTQGFNTIMSFSYNTGMFLVLGAVFKYLHDLVIIDSYKPLYRMPLFWIAIGIIIFYSSLFPLLSFFNRFLALDYDFTLRLMSILSIGNIFLSLGYFGAVICQWNTKSLSTNSQ